MSLARPPFASPRSCLLWVFPFQELSKANPCFPICSKLPTDWHQLLRSRQAPKRDHPASSSLRLRTTQVGGSSAVEARPAPPQRTGVGFHRERDRSDEQTLYSIIIFLHFTIFVPPNPTFLFPSRDIFLFYDVYDFDAGRLL